MPCLEGGKESCFRMTPWITIHGRKWAKIFLLMFLDRRGGSVYIICMCIQIGQ